MELSSQKSLGKAAVLLQEVAVRKSYSFLDYITGGTQLNCTIAIDFTGTFLSSGSS